MFNPRRARTLVDFEVQTSLLRKVSIHWILLMIANATALFMWTALMNAPIHSWSELTFEFFKLYTPLLLVSIALLPVFLLDTAKLSNRFAGPMIRIRRTLTALVNGEKVAPVKFRENDFWRELADEFNQALQIQAQDKSVPQESSAAK